MKTTIAFICIVLILLANTACKKYKYPESTYKGDPSKPENCPFFGHITIYKVNGIDSLDLLDKYIDTINVADYKSIHIRNCEFFKRMDYPGQLDVDFGWGVGNMAAILYKFSENRKKIQISFGTGGIYLDKDFFIDKNIWWDIIRLTPDNNPFKIKTILDNGNIYEIQIR